jgi:leucyl aminopeptidase
MLEFDVAAGSGFDAAADLLALPVTARPDAADPLIETLGKTLGVDIPALAAEELFEGRADQQLSLFGRDRVPAKRLLIVGGDSRATAYLRFRTFAVAALRRAMADNLRHVALVFPDLGDLPVEDWIEAAVVGATAGAYRFDRFLTGDRKPRSAVDRVVLWAPPGTGLPRGRALRTALARAAALASAIDLARDLVNRPPNHLAPEDLAAEARRVARRAKLGCTVWDLREIRRRGLHLLAAVNAGSADRPARFIQLRYRPPRKPKRHVVLVGKGLTFDSGGLCIKNPKGMADMKVDMAGAALTLGVMAAAAARKPAVGITALIPATDNMPSGTAMRPGDVVAAFGGRTVEIVNTDAEGRLILADALAFAGTLAPDLIIDHATLTGACMVALGPYAAGLFSNDDESARRFLDEAARTGEQYWRLPLAEDLKEQIRSDVADVKNIGDGYGGAITAALFLHGFVDSTPWIHLDVAGPANGEKATPHAPRGGTGFGIPTLVRFLERL